MDAFEAIGIIVIEWRMKGQGKLPRRVNICEVITVLYVPILPQ